MELLDFQQMRMDAIARSAVEIVAGPNRRLIDPDTLERVGPLMAEALRKSGVPVVCARADVEDGKLRIVLGLVQPAGVG